MSVTAATEVDQTNAEERRSKGEFVRGISGCRNSFDDPEFPPEPNRYALLLAKNCPWSGRTYHARVLLGLEETVGLDVCYPNRSDGTDPEIPDENLWYFDPKKPSLITGEPYPDTTSERSTGQNFRTIKQVYEFAGIEDEKSVPVLFDKKTKKIVNNESSEIIRMLSKHAKALGAKNPIDFYPEKLREEIDEVNELVYTKVANGAYRAGFSSIQEIYDEAFKFYFEALEKLNSILEKKSKKENNNSGKLFLCGDQLTEADVRLFPPLLRHDAVYYVRMKLNGAFIYEYKYLWRWLCGMVNYSPEMKESSVISLQHSIQGYFARTGNKTIPRGPLKPFPYPEAFDHPELADKYSS